jgi:hypothetical protein
MRVGVRNSVVEIQGFTSALTAVYRNWDQSEKMVCRCSARGSKTHNQSTPLPTPRPPYPEYLIAHQASMMRKEGQTAAQFFDRIRSR